MLKCKIDLKEPLCELDPKSKLWDTRAVEQERSGQA